MTTQIEVKLSRMRNAHVNCSTRWNVAALARLEIEISAYSGTAVKDNL